jgi:hypothetical protein
MAKEKIQMSAEDVKERLRSRHPATSSQNGHVMPGPWTTLTEYEGIDLLAISANKTPATGAQRAGDYSWVGYEVKVSRSDYRREILDPSKRLMARMICHEFYFAVPKGLLKEDEIAYQCPDFVPGDFVREICPKGCRRHSRHRSISSRTIGVNGKSGREETLPTVLGDEACAINPLFVDERDAPRPPRSYEANGWVWVPCEECGGKGYKEKSRVEREAPTLFVPPDVGLVEVTGSRCNVIRKSPVCPPKNLSPEQLGTLARWISLRPDPRHEGVINGLAETRRKAAEWDRQRGLG